MNQRHITLAQGLATQFALLPQVEAVTLGGSQTAQPDEISDLDLYVFTRADIPLSDREQIVLHSGGAAQSSLGLEYWGPGDEWIDAASGLEVDIVFFDAGWMAEQIDRVVRHHIPSLGYTTCFWHTVRYSRILHDPNNWFQALQIACGGGYPEELRRNIIAYNHPVLRNVIPSYTAQIEKAVQRRDLISINHRLAALFASYFDVLFALNRRLHPGEKRLLPFARENCPVLPVRFEEEISEVLGASTGKSEGLIPALNNLIDHLDDVLIGSGFDPHSGLPMASNE